MSAGHAELIGEMAALEKLSMPDRLKHAKKRRAQQLKAYAQYEKQLNKEITKKSKKGHGTGTASTGLRYAAKLRFDPSILLLEATMRNDVEEVNNLLNAGVDPNVSNEDGLRALHQCSIDNLEQVMKLLIQFHANVNVCDTEMWTPLHAAATCGHMTACRYLIEHGAELLAVNSDGNMSYDLCEDPDTLDYIESEMAKRGVTQEMIDDIRLSAENKMLSDLKHLHETGSNLEYAGNNGETPLHVAACNGYVYVTEFLLVHHVAVNVPDDDGWMPLHCAACWGQLPVVELLLQHGADFEAKTKNGETTLDLCDDIEMKQRVLEIVDEIKNKQPHKSRDNSVIRRNSAARKGSTATAHAMRRTNPHDKTSIAHIEAHEEAMRLRESVNSLDDDDDFEENFVVLDAITVPQFTEGGDINIVMPDNTTKNKTASKTETEQKPIKSIMSKSSNTDRNSRNSSSVPLPSDIWMTQTSNDQTNETNKDTKDKQDSSTIANNSKSKSEAPTAGAKSVTGGTAPSKSAKAPTGPAETAKTAKNEVSSTDSAKTSQQSMPSSAAPKNTPPSNLQKDVKNKPKEQASATNDARSSKASAGMPGNGTSQSGDASKSSKVTAGAESSRNSHVINSGPGQPPSGTLADLKKQRARRHQDTIASSGTRENGNVPAVTDSGSANGRAVEMNDRNGNNLSSRTAGGSYNDRSRRRFRNVDEVVDGGNDDRRCCVLL